MGTFNPREYLRQLQGKDYLDVKWRLVWFHQDTGPKAGYLTVETAHDLEKGFAKFFTIAWDGKDAEWRQIELNGIKVDVCGRVATGEGSETLKDFRDYYEKAATKSLGRALGGLGFGTQFSPELDEGDRVVDSPDQPRAQPGQKPAQKETSPGEAQNELANEQQLQSIRKLCAALGREEPDPKVLTFTGASALLRDLSKEYNQRRRAS